MRIVRMRVNLNRTSRRHVRRTVEIHCIRRNADKPARLHLNLQTNSPPRGEESQEASLIEPLGPQCSCLSAENSRNPLKNIERIAECSSSTVSSVELSAQSIRIFRSVQSCIRTSLCIERRVRLRRLRGNVLAIDIQTLPLISSSLAAKRQRSRTASRWRCQSGCVERT